MMNKFLVLALLFAVSSLNLVKAEDRQGYALDKLANAQAQLDRLKAQKDAISQLIKAVRKDLHAAKIRAKAEEIQLKADTDRQDATIAVEQTGVAVDLPNLMATKGVKAGLLEYDQNENINLMFEDKTNEKAVFFPGGDTGRSVRPSGIPNDAEIPDYIK
ncbi:MAG: hypothetical protein HOA17_00290 [Candidatus Melainabacteria bacterium]|nr:hypothetical protein [Candidatus Melainabacteria bacterium]